MNRIQGLLFLLFIGAPVASGQDPGVEVVVDGLTHPSAIAIQPGTGHVFVSDSGAGRVVRVVDGELEPVITGFDVAALDNELPYDAGPLGLAFLNQETLVVGEGGMPVGEDLLRIFEVPKSGESPITTDVLKKPDPPKTNREARSLFPPVAPVPEPLSLPSRANQPGLGDYYGILATEEAVYASTSGDAGRGWIARADRIRDGLTFFQRFIGTQTETKSSNPMAITRSPEGYLAIGLAGNADSTGDSKLAFYNEQGELLGSFPMGLNDVVGIAYGPKYGRLFAIDFDRQKPGGGGLYKIVATDDEVGCKPVKIMDLASPTAMRFDSRGDLYVSLLGDSNSTNDEGTGEPQGKKPAGQLLKITGLDTKPKDE